MAETQVENRICNACGSEVRRDALFCYHCGGSVAPEIVVALKDKQSFMENENGNKSAQGKIPKIDESIDKPIPKPGLPEEPKLQSAAAMRRKSKSFQPNKVEVIWEERENAANIWFILAAIVITLLAVGILYLSFYLK